MNTRKRDADGGGKGTYLNAGARSACWDQNHNQISKGPECTDQLHARAGSLSFFFSNMLLLILPRIWDGCIDLGGVNTRNPSASGPITSLAVLYFFFFLNQSRLVYCNSGPANGSPLCGLSRVHIEMTGYCLCFMVI